MSTRVNATTPTTTHPAILARTVRYGPGHSHDRRRHGGVPGGEAETGGGGAVDHDVVQHRLRPAPLHDLLDRLRQQPRGRAATGEGDGEPRSPGR